MPFINLIGPEWAVRLVIWLPTGLDCEQKEEGVGYITVSFSKPKFNPKQMPRLWMVWVLSHVNTQIKPSERQRHRLTASPLGRVIHQLADRVTNLRNILCLDWSPVFHYFQRTEEQINTYKYINEKSEHSYDWNVHFYGTSAGVVYAVAARSV